jgi:hypothetical protein
MTATQKIEARISRCSVDALKEMALALFANDSDEAGAVLPIVLDALMARMPEADFTSFCEAM